MIKTIYQFICDTCGHIQTFKTMQEAKAFSTYHSGAHKVETKVYKSETDTK